MQAAEQSARQSDTSSSSSTTTTTTTTASSSNVPGRVKPGQAHKLITTATQYSNPSTIALSSSAASGSLNTQQPSLLFGAQFGQPVFRPSKEGNSDSGSRS